MVLQSEPVAAAGRTWTSRSSASRPAERKGILAGCLRRWGLQLRRCRVRTFHGWEAPEPADGGDRSKSRWDGILDGHRRRGVFSFGWCTIPRICHWGWSLGRDRRKRVRAPGPPLRPPLTLGPDAMIPNQDCS